MVKRITKRTRLAQKKRKKNVFLAIAVLCLLVIAYAGLGWGLTQQKVAITTITANGNEVVSTEGLEATVRQGLAVTRGLLLYGGTVFTYDKNSIVRDLLDTYPRLASVELKASKIDTLELVVTERVAVAQWCDGRVASEIVEVGPLQFCYLIDKDGLVFENVARETLTSGPLATLVTYSGDLSGDVMRQVLLHGAFAPMYEFIEKLKIDIGVDVTQVKLLDDEAEVYSNEHAILRIKLDDNLIKTLSYIKITLDSEEYKEFAAPQEDEESTEAQDKYIDLRFGNRVYYK